MSGAPAPGARAEVVTVAEVKKALVAAGLEVYRTRGDVIWLADRVRENLLMDAGAFVGVGEALRVGIVVRAQASELRCDAEAQLFDHARALAAPAISAGYREVSAELQRVADPGDAARILDTLCEVQLEKPAADLAGAVDEARRAVAFNKAASR